MIRGFGWLVLLAVLCLPGPALAADPNRAALVVQSGDGQVETRCIPFDEEEINGAELLTRSGLEVVLETAGSMGVTVCKIADQGCNYPAEHCFCQCMGLGSSGCAYWNYFYRDAGEEEWTYSALGAVLRRVTSGSVEAWVWGDGHTPPAADLTFEAICVPATPTATVGPPTPTPAHAAAPAVEPTARPTLSPTPTDLPLIPTPTATLPPVVVAPDLSTYLPFGFVLLGLAALGAVAWLRRT